MRSINLAQIIVVVILFRIASAVPTDRTSDLTTVVTASSLEPNEKTFLRSLQAKTDKPKINPIPADEEERAVNFSFLNKLKKFVPGTEAFKKAQKLEKENLFVLSGTRDDQIFPKFEEWYKAGKATVQVEEGVQKKMGLSQTEAEKIGNAFL